MLYYLRVFDRNSNTLIGHSVDMTAEGVRLISEHPIEKNTMFHLRMVLPKEIMEKRELYFDAESVWYQKDINPKYYNIGFRFRRISSDHFVVIDKLLDDFSFQN